MADMGTCPLPDLVDSFRKSATKMLDKQDFLQGMVFNIIANRFEECHSRITQLVTDLAVRDKEARDRLKRIEELEMEIGR